MQALLPSLPDGSHLSLYVPDEQQIKAGGQYPDDVQAWQRKAAVAGTLIAGLEMTKQGTLVLEQYGLFTGIHFHMSEITETVMPNWGRQIKPG